MIMPFLWRWGAPHLPALFWGILGIASVAQAADTTVAPFAGLVRTHRQGPETNAAERLLPGPTIGVGDHEDSAGHGTVQGFVGFDLKSLPGGQITGARLTLREATAVEAQGGFQTGDPFGQSNPGRDLGEIFVERAVDKGVPGIGVFNLTLGPPSSSIRLTRSPLQTNLWSADVSTLVQSARNAGDSFVVFRLRFEKLRNNNGQIDTASFVPLSLVVTTSDATPQLLGTLDADRSRVSRNQLITYTLRLRTFNAPATNARITVTVPNFTTFSGGGLTDPRFTGTGNTRTASIGSFSAATTPGIRFSVQVNADAPFGTVLRPTFTIQTDNLPAASGTHLAGVTIQKPHLTVTVTPNRTMLAPGERLIYTLRGRVEGGPLALGRVDFSLQGLPLMLNKPGTSQENLIDFSGEVYGYAFDDLADGQQFTRTIALDVNSVATLNTSFRLSVVVISRPPNSEADAISITNEVPLVAVGGKTALIIVAAAPKFVDQGQTLTYNVAVANSGTVTAPNVRVFADIPPGTTYVAGSARFQLLQGTASVQNSNIVFALSQPLPAGQAAVMRYSVRVSDKFRGRFGNSLLNRSVHAVADNTLTTPSAQVRTGIGAGGDDGLALQDFVSGIGGTIGSFFKGIGDAIGNFFGGLFGGGATKPGAAPDSNLPPEVRRLLDSHGLSIGFDGAPIVAVGSANIIALNAGNIIALGSANLINGNGSTTVTISEANPGTSTGGNIITIGSANTVTVGSGKFASITAAQLLGLSGPNALPPAPGTGIVALGGGNVLSGNNIVALGDGNARALGSNNLTQAQRATVTALGGANFISYALN